ncbi:t-SNARE coiled-coil homology domain-containing protein [Meloidogyne graminicola]|uniref:t-SNARE coiled-coil homology domain-containing protein n=1 Tax=Meloidogyne graminicola TaxID=189291 RepID=A0A8T0A413_9BILA|nr:t-SNARE coiled-coil homology domain-containing protein [Meloidogyne graminicola]
MDHFISVLNQLQESKRRAVNYEKSKIQNVSDNNQFNYGMTIQMQAQQNRNLEEIQGRQQQSLNLKKIYLKNSFQTLSSLEKEIDDINQIFTDLAQMVHNQNEVVETIEANIEITNAQMQQGSIQVSQANQYQMGSRRKKLFLSIFCIFILIIFISIFWIWIRK